MNKFRQFLTELSARHTILFHVYFHLALPFIVIVEKMSQVVLFVDLFFFNPCLAE